MKFTENKAKCKYYESQGKKHWQMWRNEKVCCQFYYALTLPKINIQCIFICNQTWISEVFTKPTNATAHEVNTESKYFYNIDIKEGQYEKECKWKSVNDHFRELINFFFQDHDQMFEWSKLIDHHVDTFTEN